MFGKSYATKILLTTARNCYQNNLPVNDGNWSQDPQQKHLHLYPSSPNHKCHTFLSLVPTPSSSEVPAPSSSEVPAPSSSEVPTPFFLWGSYPLLPLRFLPLLPLRFLPLLPLRFLPPSSSEVPTPFFLWGSPPSSLYFYKNICLRMLHWSTTGIGWKCLKISLN